MCVSCRATRSRSEGPRAEERDRERCRATSCALGCFFSVGFFCFGYRKGASCKKFGGGSALECCILAKKRKQLRSGA